MIYERRGENLTRRSVPNRSLTRAYLSFSSPNTETRFAGHRRQLEKFGSSCISVGQKPSSHGTSSHMAHRVLHPFLMHNQIFFLPLPAGFAILVPDEPQNPETPPRRRPRPRPARGRTARETLLRLVRGGRARSRLGGVPPRLLARGLPHGPLDRPHPAHDRELAARAGYPSRRAPVRDPFECIM